MTFQRVILENFSGCKPPDPQMSLKDVDIIVPEKCASIDGLHTENI